MLRRWHRPIVRVVTVLLVANSSAGAVTVGFLMYLIPGRHTGGLVADANHLTAFAMVIYLCCALPLAAAVNARLFRPVARWLAADRRPTLKEQEATLAQPIRQAAGAFAFWVLAACLYGAVTAVEGYSSNRVQASVIGVLLGGLASCSLIVFAVERALRPVVAHALGGDLPLRPSRSARPLRTIVRHVLGIDLARRPLGVGVRSRVLLAWAFGSGVPIIGLILVVTDTDIRTVHSLMLPLVALCGIALVTGVTLASVAAGSVAEPLEAVRRALQRVERGDLSVVVPVDDAGEVGEVEAGVNRMVTGLRQRRELEDLFGRYVGEAVAERALERGNTLGGERRAASALFVDLVGSTKLAASLPPEDVVRGLNLYFEAVVDTVAAEGGWVNKFEGDGALCVFGPPGEVDHHAAHALRAARALHARLDLEQPIVGRLDAAIGVSSGTVVAGNIGSPERFEYTIIGDPVNEASRLTEQAKAVPRRVLASAAVVAASGEEASHWQRAEEITLRGRSAPTVVFTPVPGSDGDGPERTTTARASTVDEAPELR